jgi:hypothetical protein
MIKLSAEDKVAFIDALRETASVSRSARRIGVGPSVVDRERRADPAFAAEWDEALQESWDERAAIYADRGFAGVSEPVFHKGVVVGHVQKYSDKAAHDTLRARLPDIFGDKSTLNVAGKLNVAMTNEIRVNGMFELVNTGLRRKADAEDLV